MARQGLARDRKVNREEQKMKKYQVTITGTQPLLMHNDDIEWADAMARWRDDKDNKKSSKAGDDRSPAYRWIGALYRNDAGQIIVPTENVMRALMEGGAMVPVPGGKSGKTFKSQSQSGIMPNDIGWSLLINGRQIDAAKTIDALLRETNFEKHKEAVQQLGFSLFLKRAKIGSSKHVRVRPRFENWSTSGELIVTDEQITTDVLSDILEMAGKYKGLGDWRPSSKTPGTFGMFTSMVEEI
jgi:hypothetical protein